jgi:hypothetical protein
MVCQGARCCHRWRLGSLATSKKKKLFMEFSALNLVALAESMVHDAEAQANNTQRLQS